MRRFACFLPVLLAVLVGRAAVGEEVFKCVDAAGRSVFSDSACGPGQEVIQYQHHETYLEKITRENAEESERRAQEKAQRDRDDARWREVVATQKAKRIAGCAGRSNQRGLKIGMTRSELLRDEIWQFPDDVSKTTTARGVSEYWVYDACEGYGSVRLFLDSDRLTSIHN